MNMVLLWLEYIDAVFSKVSEEGVTGNFCRKDFPDRQKFPSFTKACKFREYALIIGRESHFFVPKMRLLCYSESM
jgi:hypothetical protein